MKILLIVPEYPPYHIGGGGEVFKSLAENYKKLGHDVVVIYGYYPTKSWWEDIKKYTDENGIKFYQIPEIPFPESMPFLKTVMPPNIKAYLKLRKIIQKERPDIAHLHGYGHFYIDYSGIICNKFKIKFIFTNHGYPKIPYFKGKPVIIIWNIYKKLLGEKLNKNAYKITCVSEFTKKEYSSKYFNKLVIIPNGIELDYKKYDENEINMLKEHLGIEYEKVLLSVGRITEYKGFQDVLNILDQISNVKYLIIGGNQDYKKELEYIIENKNIKNKVIFIGKVENNRLDFFYQVSDVVIIPSKVESFGLVGLEALRNKKCVISSGVQGLKYLKDSKNVYEYKIQQDLINLIKQDLIYMPENFIKNFEWQSIARLYLNNF